MSAPLVLGIPDALASAHTARVDKEFLVHHVEDVVVASLAWRVARRDRKGSFMSLADVFGAELLTPDGAKVPTAEALQGKVVGIFSTAMW